MKRVPKWVRFLWAFCIANVAGGTSLQMSAAAGWFTDSAFVTAVCVWIAFLLAGVLVFIVLPSQSENLK